MPWEKVMQVRGLHSRGCPAGAAGPDQISCGAGINFQIKCGSGR